MILVLHLRTLPVLCTLYFVLCTLYSYTCTWGSEYLIHFCFKVIHGSCTVCHGTFRLTMTIKHTSCANARVLVCLCSSVKAIGGHKPPGHNPWFSEPCEISIVLMINNNDDQHHYHHDDRREDNDGDADTLSWRLLGRWQDFTANRRQSRHPVYAVIRRRRRAAEGRGQMERFRRRCRWTGRREHGDRPGRHTGRRPRCHHHRCCRLRLRASGRAASQSRHHRHHLVPFILLKLFLRE